MKKTKYFVGGAYVKMGKSVWVRMDTYQATIPCPHRLRTALRVLLRGSVHVTWKSPAGLDANKYVLEGEKV